jgi:hypothetical protein
LLAELFQYSPVHDHGAPTAGLRRKAKKQFAPPPDDCIELAEARPVIKSFHLTTQDAAAKLEKISKLRVGTTISFLASLLIFVSLVAGGAGFCEQDLISGANRTAFRPLASLSTTFESFSSKV